MHIDRRAGKMRRHATTMVAAVLCLLLFSGRLAAAEKSFGGGYGGLDAGGGQQPQATATATATAQPEVGGGAGGYSTPSEATPSTPAAEETTTTTTPAAASSGGEASAGGGGYSTPGEAAPSGSTPAAEETTTTTTPAGGEASAGGGGYSTPSEAAPSTPAAEETTPTPEASSGGYGGAPAGKAGGGGLDPDGDPEVGLNEKAIKEIVDEHNVFRAKENAGLPPLVWNATLAKFSQQYAETLKGNCQQIHSSSPYGENLMEGTPGLTWKITVDGWSEEKKNYHYANDGCDPGKMCGHYKAVVWKTTTSVGCGRIKCNSGDSIIMCSYWPPGNYDGVKPY